MLTDAQGRVIGAGSGGSMPTFECEYNKSTHTCNFFATSALNADRMAASWGTSDAVTSAAGGAYSVSIGGRVYTFSPGSVGLGVPLPTIVAEYEVITGTSTPRPVSTYADNFIVRNIVAIEFGGAVSFGDLGTDFERLSVATPTSEYPDDPWDITLWTDWRSDDLGGATQPMTDTMCGFTTSGEPSIPAAAIWSFGNLLTYPGVPTIG